MDVLRLLDELRILAQNGIQYAEDPYDEARYDRILELVCECYGDTLALPPEEIRHRFREELGHVTPKVGAEAAMFDTDGQILLMRRADDGRWCLPCGWVEPNESPSEAAARETREETGLSVDPVELVDVYHRPPGGRFGPHGEVAVLYRCERTGGSLTLSPEGEELRYWALEEVPAWHKRHETYARDAKTAWTRQQPHR